MFVIPPDTFGTARALADPTRFEVYSRIAEADGPVTVKELTRWFSLHHSAIRVHLRRLEEAGLITAEAVHRSGVVGRPELSFRPGPRAVNIQLPPRNLQFLAQLALEYCTANDSNTEGLATFGEEWGRRVARELPAVPKGPLPLAAAVEVAAAALRGLGCAARIENGEGRGLALIEGSCLFSPLSSSHAPVVCQVHQALIRGMLLELTGSNGFRLDHVASLALGHRTCRTQIIPSAS